MKNNNLYIKIPIEYGEFTNPVSFDYDKDLNKSIDNQLEYNFNFENSKIKIPRNTFLKDVKLLDPGSYLTLNLNNQNLKKFKYWDYHFREPKKIYNKKYYVEKLENLLMI